VGETNKGDKKAAFNGWKTDIQSVTLKEWQAQSKKRLGTCVSSAVDAGNGETPRTTAHSEQDTRSVNARNSLGNRKLER